MDTEKRRAYPADFKREALELWNSTEKSSAQIERDLGITPGLLAKWKQTAQTNGDAAFPGRGRLTDDQEYIRQLERELAVTKQERDILKKTVAIFGKDEK